MTKAISKEIVFFLKAKYILSKAKTVFLKFSNEEKSLQCCPFQFCIFLLKDVVQYHKTSTSST